MKMITLVAIGLLTSGIFSKNKARRLNSNDFNGLNNSQPIISNIQPIQMMNQQYQNMPQGNTWVRDQREISNNFIPGNPMLPQTTYSPNFSPNFNPNFSPSFNQPFYNFNTQQTPQTTPQFTSQPTPQFTPQQTPQFTPQENIIAPIEKPKRKLVHKSSKKLYKKKQVLKKRKSRKLKSDRELQYNQYNQNNNQYNQNNNQYNQNNNQYNQNNNQYNQNNNQYNQNNNQYNQNNNQYNQNGQGYNQSLPPVPPGEERTFLLEKPLLDCDISLEVFPLFYTPIIRQNSFRLRFDSRCIKPKTIEFEVLYKNDEFINWNFHPTTINLLLWGNWYQIKYHNPQVIDKYDIMKALMYKNATLSDTKEIALDLLFENQNFLTQQQFDSFNRNNLKKLADLPGNFTCYTRQKRMPNFYDRVIEREKMQKMARDNNMVIEDPLLTGDHIPSQPFPEYLKEQLSFEKKTDDKDKVKKSVKTQRKLQLDDGAPTDEENGNTNQLNIPKAKINEFGGIVSMTETIIKQEYAPNLNMTNPNDAVEEQMRLMIRNNTIARLKERFFIEDIQIFCEIR